MPDRDFTVEMWVRTPEYKESASPLENELFMNMYSYATHAVRDSSGTASCELLLSCHRCTFPKHAHMQYTTS